MGVIGCGAAAEYVHLPVITRYPGATVTCLVDQSLDRANRLAGIFGIPQVSQDLSEIVEDLDAAVVAVPHHAHASISTYLLQHGVSVLVEKPMALTVGECLEMISAADASKSTLAVGHMRRLLPSSQVVKTLIDEGALGPLLRFEVREGKPYDWNVASDASFKSQYGGGVLADLGSHVLDLLLFWLGDLEVLAYKDDAMGGVEADCFVDLGMGTQLRGVVELSRTRRLLNQCSIHGKRSSLKIGSNTDEANPEISMIVSGHTLTGRAETQFDRLQDVLQEQFRRFVGAIRGEGAPAASGYDGMKVIELFEQCRALRSTWIYPWLAPFEGAKEAG